MASFAKNFCYHLFLNLIILFNFAKETKTFPNFASRPPSFSFDSTDIQVVLARSHARRVALGATFHAPESRAFGCPEEHPKPRGATVGGANFGHGAKTPGRDEARDGAKASGRSGFETKRRPRGEVALRRCEGLEAK